MVSDTMTASGKATLSTLTRQLGQVCAALTEERDKCAALEERISKMQEAAFAQQDANERRLGEEERRRKLVELELEAVREQLSNKTGELKAATVVLKAAQTATKRAETALQRATQAHEAAVTRAVARAEEGARATQQRWVVLQGELSAMAARVEAGEATIRELTKLLEAEKRGRARTVEAADKAEERRRAALKKREEEREQKRYVHQRLSERVRELEKETNTLRADLKAAREEVAAAAPAAVSDANPRHLCVIGRSIHNGNTAILAAARAMSETDSDLARLLRQLARLADAEDGTPDALVARRAIRGAFGAK